MIVVYPIGFPLTLLALMWSRREDIRTRQSRHGDASLDYLAWFIRLYAPDMYWVAVLDLLRRLCLSSFLLVLDKGYQLLTALFVSAASVIITRE